MYFFYQLLQISQYCFTNVIFKKVQMALENVLAGTFLPQGSDLPNPALDQQANMPKQKLILINPPNLQ